MTDTLLVLPGSHYGERARLGLLAAGRPHRVERLAPGWHVAVLKRRVPGLPATTLPVLLPASGPAVQGSGEILAHLGLKSSQPEAEAFVADTLAPLARRIFYTAAQGNAGNEAALRRAFFGPGWAGHAGWAVLRQLLLRRFASARGEPAALWPLLQGEMDAALRHAESKFSPAIDSESADTALPDTPQFDPLDRRPITCAALLGPLLPTAPAPLPGFAWPAPMQQALSAWSGRPLMRLAAQASASLTR